MYVSIPGLLAWSELKRKRIDYLRLGAAKATGGSRKPARGLRVPAAFAARWSPADSRSFAAFSAPAAFTVRRLLQGGVTAFVGADADGVGDFANEDLAVTEGGVAHIGDHLVNDGVNQLIRYNGAH